MNKVMISEFKAKCIQMLKEVDASGKPLVVTHRGRALVTINPMGSGRGAAPRLGQLRGDITIKGDIVGFDWSDDWE